MSFPEQQANHTLLIHSPRAYLSFALRPIDCFYSSGVELKKILIFLGNAFDPHDNIYTARWRFKCMVFRTYRKAFFTLSI